MNAVIGNLCWLVADKAFRLGLSFSLAIWIARHLGPQHYGQLNYALALMTLAGVFVSLGLNGLVVRDLVSAPESAPQVLGAAFLLQITGACIAVTALLCIAVAPFTPDPTAWLIIITSVSLIFRSWDGIRYWFEAKVQSKYVVWADTLAFSASALFKLALLLTGAPVALFAAAVLFESACSALALLVIYRTFAPASASKWTISVARAKQMAREAWPLAFSAFAIAIYTRIDQLMLSHMLGDKSVGIYAAAVRVSEVLNYIPAIVVASAAPLIISRRQANAAEYERGFQSLYDGLTVVSVGSAAVITLAAPTIVQIMYGDSYAASASVLAISIWTSVFVCFNTASGRWLISENLAQLALKRNVLGAVVNVILNLILIPLWREPGAAAATLISYGTASYLSDIAQRQTHIPFKQKTRALLFVNVVKRLHRLGGNAK